MSGTGPVYDERHRPEIVASSEAKTFRKTATIVAIRARGDFGVATDRGLMEGKAGDWLVTNHPDDDPGSDVWTISAERMAATYVEAVLPETTGLIPGDWLSIGDDMKPHCPGCDGHDAP